MEDDLITLGRMGTHILWHLDYTIRPSVSSQKMFNLLNRNKATLKILVIYGGGLYANAPGQPRQSNHLFFTRAASYLGSNLSRLGLVDLRINRDTLSIVLELCEPASLLTVPV
ncbi:hypothetical protein BG015_010394 [Linnemannia schmuckeri]|uniref:Uncharacterized protein n=1 Tax=Linnemannia schmuckeri TaxID=64567 RepID=A0A9P5RU56_9FUNG|nr:hypothetical protein BG015_010394 [Linnemannia schmuckeri]